MNFEGEKQKHPDDNGTSGSGEQTINGIGQLKSSVAMAMTQRAVTHLTQVCMNWGKLVCVHLHFVYCLFKDDDTSQRLEEEEEGEETFKRCSRSEAHKHSGGRDRLACVSLWNVLKYLDEEEGKKGNMLWLDSESD